VAQWRALVTTTHGLMKEDPRVGPVLSALAVCDAHYKGGDVDRFQVATERVRRLMQFAPGAMIRWESRVHDRLVILGPGRIEHVHDDHGRLQVFVIWEDTARWISDAIITEIEEPIR
jgi:RecB family endonuclease NucS